MSRAANEDPTIPPPGRRTGKGAESVVPYLKRSMAAKPRANAIAGDETLPLAARPGRGDDQGADSTPDYIL